MLSLMKTSVLGFTICVTASSLSALPLAPGGLIFPGGTTADAANSGVVQNDNLINFSLDPTPVTPFTNVGGVVQNRVVRNAANNLVFAPRIRDTFNIDGGTFVIAAFRLNGYGMFDLDVDYRTDGLGDKGFSSVSRSANGNTMTFRYDNPLFVDAINPPGRQEESLFPSIVSNATDYDFLGTMEIFGYVLPLGADEPDPNASLFSVTLEGIAVPIAPIPIPAAGLLLLAGLGSLALIKRRS